MLAVDHVELRRWLVDNAVLARDGFGRAYTRGQPHDEIAGMIASSKADVPRSCATRASGTLTSAPRRTAMASRAPREPGRMTRQNIATGTPWEPIVGYSRAVRVGQPRLRSRARRRPIATAAIVGMGDPYAQTRQSSPTSQPRSRARAHASTDVVRTRIFVTDIAQWEAVGRAHGEAFGDIRPACTMVEVAKLIAPEILVEIEADAVIGDVTVRSARRRRRSRRTRCTTRGSAAHSRSLAPR